MAFTVNSQTQTGVDCPAVEEDCASPAVSHVTNFFSAGQGNVVTQGVEQGSPRFQYEYVFFSVDL
jgi:hypothetical protein